MLLFFSADGREICVLVGSFAIKRQRVYRVDRGLLSTSAPRVEVDKRFPVVRISQEGLTLSTVCEVAFSCDVIDVFVILNAILGYLSHAFDVEFNEVFFVRCLEVYVVLWQRKFSFLLVQGKCSAFGIW